MSNRRRARGPVARRTAIERAAQCPDCNSEVVTRWAREGELTRLEVRHDDTCPWYARRGGQAFTALKVVTWSALS